MKYKITILLLVTVALMMFGCSDRGTNVEPRTYYRGGLSSVASFTHQFETKLALSMFEAVRKSPVVKTRVYTPLGFDLSGKNNTALPVLYLLAPFGGDELYYFNRGLMNVADQMIAEGTIKPMIIVCVDGSQGYGGTFYGNSYAGGRYATILGDIQTNPLTGTLIDYVDAALDTDTSAGGTGRAISGFGMGGYGAMRIAAQFSQNFGSVSAVSAPLSFNAAGGFPTVFEQIVDDLNPSGTISKAVYKSLDTTAGDALAMVMAAACSFSPLIDYDTLLYIIGGNPPIPVAGDTTRFADTTTLITRTSGIKFLLPFDTTGAVYDTVWSLWMNNDISSILSQNPAAYDSMAIGLFMASDEGFGFNNQTISFANYLQTYLAGRGITRNLTPLTFSGFEGSPATVDNYTYDILPAVLKFHSDNFGEPYDLYEN